MQWPSSALALQMENQDYFSRIISSEQMEGDLLVSSLFSIQKCGHLNHVGIEISVEILWSNLVSKQASLDVLEVSRI